MLGFFRLEKILPINLKIPIDIGFYPDVLTIPRRIAFRHQRKTEAVINGALFLPLLFARLQSTFSGEHGFFIRRLQSGAREGA